MTMRRTSLPACAALAALVLSAPLVVRAQPAAELLKRGEYVMRAGGCVACHTVAADKAGLLAGGRALDTPFGRFYTPNITPDPDTG